jgi:hypothetical protein
MRKAILLILLSILALPGCGVVSLHSPWPFVDASRPGQRSPASAIASSSAPASQIGG